LALREAVSGSPRACIEEINFKIKRRFEDEGIEMAYPTQTVHLVKKAASGD
jgi:small-conductance mechanosensitive channel